MILYIKNPKVSIQKLLELITEFSQVTEYKFHIQKAIAFFYTKWNIRKKKIEKKIVFKIMLKNT